MAKKKRKTRVNRVGEGVNRPRKVAPQQISPATTQKIDQQAQAVMVNRLKKAFTALSAEPEGLLPLLDRLEIPWEKAYLDEKFLNESDKAGDDCLVIKWTDLLEGEKRNQLMGSILKRLYGESAESVFNMNNEVTVQEPLTGEVINPPRADMPSAEQFKEVLSKLGQAVKDRQQQ